MKKKNIEDLRFIEAVQERDIDLLLLEELHVSPKFRKWFAKEITGKKMKDFVGAWHSISGPNGESDIVFIFRVQSGEKYALLIENKVGALAQKKQPQRYSERGEEGKVKKDWDECKTCIVAPEKYLQTNKESKDYDSKISYQVISKWFLKNKSERNRYKSEIITEAIEQNRRGWNQIVDEKTSRFWRDYYKYVSKKYPEFEMKEPSSKSAGESWVRFHPRTLKKKISIHNKLTYLYKDHGVVDLEFAGYGEKLDKLEQILKPYLNKNRTLEPTYKSASLRIKLPYIDTTSSFSSQIKKVEEGLKAAKKLLKIGERIVNYI